MRARRGCGTAPGGRRFIAARLFRRVKAKKSGARRGGRFGARGVRARFSRTALLADVAGARRRGARRFSRSGARGPSGGGGGGPCGRSRLPFSCENRALSCAGAFWGDRSESSLASAIMGQKTKLARAAAGVSFTGAASQILIIAEGRGVVKGRGGVLRAPARRICKNTMKICLPAGDSRSFHTSCD